MSFSATLIFVEIMTWKTKQKNQSAAVGSFSFGRAASRMIWGLCGIKFFTQPQMVSYWNGRVDRWSSFIHASECECAQLCR